MRSTTSSRAITPDPGPGFGPADEGYRPDPRRWRALGVSQLAGFMALLDISIVVIALPSIERELGASAEQVQWVVSGYALVFGLVLVAGGRLGDAFGRRRMFVLALTGFVLTSALAGAAPNPELLVAARLLQGASAGMLTPQNSGLIQDLFRGAERGRAFGIFGATVGLSTAIGPVLGGVLLALSGGPDGWRWVFYVNIPIGVLTLVLAMRWLPPPLAPRRGVWRELDVLGAALLGAAVFSVLLPLVEAGSGGLAKLWWLFPLAALLLAGFVGWEVRTVRTGGFPLLDPRLITRTPGYPAGAGLALLYFVGFSGIWLVLAMFFQNGLGFSPLQSGLAVTPFALGSAASAAVAGRLVARYERRVTVLGLCGVLVGLIGTAIVLRTSVAGSAAWVAALPLLIAGVGGGAVISPNLTLTLQAVPPAMGGAAGGAVQTAQRIGAAIGTAVLATVFYATVSGGGSRAYQDAIFAALLCAVGFVVASLVVAILELRARARRAAVPQAALQPLS